MAQTTLLINTLKKTLKLHGKTYADVAVGLGLSEASVKRLFADESFSLQRLDQVCQLLGLEISDLTALMQAQSAQLHQLSAEQEAELTTDLTLLLITVCVLNKWSMAQIVEYYEITDAECIQKLAQLDRLKIIELLPANRIKLLVAPNFGWLDNGPIQQFFQQKIGQEFFQKRFNFDDESLLVLNGMLSSQSNGEFQRKLKRIAREFEAMNTEDASLPLEHRKGFTLVLAMRNWRYGLFKPLLKPNK
ncbi:helix-turn-helix domain-containing protein [Glaciecola sp. SC05]|uniref:helix-turn-helix domain-containing protein n=1 Tax=Glaciecola sp. SC05 TaxID=1987355 RepID=UPI0035297448